MSARLEGELLSYLTPEQGLLLCSLQTAVPRVFSPDLEDFF